MAKFKAVIIADTHLTHVNKYGVIEDGLNSRLRDNLDNIKESVQVAIDKKVDYWIHLGDVFHKINPGEKLRDLFFEAIEPLLGKIPVIIIVGNHDTDLSEVHSLMTDHKVINSIKPGLFRVINEPQLVSLKGVKTLFVPWVEEEEMASSLKGESNAVIFGHLTVKGAQPSGTEFILREGITPSLFNKHRKAYLGHYHKPQEASKWAYIGSSYKQDMGERGQEKRFLLLEADENELKEKYFPIDKRRLIQFEVNEDEPKIPLIEEGDIVKMTLVGSRSWVYAQDKNSIKKELISKGAQKVIIDSKITKEGVDKENQLDYQSAGSWDKIITKFTKIKGAEEHANFGKKLFKGDIKIEA